MFRLPHLTGIEMRDVGLCTALFADDPFRNHTPAFMWSEANREANIRTVAPECMKLLKSVRYAQRKKTPAPFVGIAVEGRETILINREVFQRSLAGLEVIDAEVCEGYRKVRYSWITKGYPMGLVRDEVVNNDPVRALVIYAVNANGNKSVQAERVFYHQTELRQRELLDAYMQKVKRKAGICDCYDWERFKACKHVVDRGKEVKTSAREKQIAKWEKKLEKMGDYGTVGWWEERWVANRCEVKPASAGARQAEMLWHLQKSIRREIMRMVKAWRDSIEKSTASLYRVVEEVGPVPRYRMVNQERVFNQTREEDREEPVYELYWDERVEVKKWSGLNKQERDKMGNSLHEYIRRLWEFCGLEGKPYRDRGEDGDEVGAKRYEYWIESLHKRKELAGMIQGLKDEGKEEGEGK